MLPNKPMHLAGAFVLKEFIVFVRSLVPCVDQLAGRPLGSRLQVMGRSVRQLFAFEETRQ
jgi:hypothetical protein